MTGKIKINDLELYANIGVSDEEKQVKQKLLLNIEFSIEINNIEDDDIGKTINYVEISEICKFAVKKKYNLIETLASFIGNEIKYKFPEIENLLISVKKPQVQMNSKVESVEVIFKY